MRSFIFIFVSAFVSLGVGAASAEPQAAFQVHFEFGVAETARPADGGVLSNVTREACRSFPVIPGEFGEIWAKEWCDEYANILIPRLKPVLVQALERNRDLLRCRLGIQKLDLYVRYLHNGLGQDVLVLRTVRPEERREILRLRLRLPQDWSEKLLGDNPDVRMVHLNRSVELSLIEMAGAFIDQVLNIAPNGEPLLFTNQTNCI